MAHHRHAAGNVWDEEFAERPATASSDHAEHDREDAWDSAVFTARGDRNIDILAEEK